MSKKMVLVSLVVCVAVSGTSKAGSLSSSFKVSATVTSKCKNVSASNISFGAFPSGTEARANGSVTVTCNEGTEFLVKLGGGAAHRGPGPGGLFGNRNLVGPLPASNELLGYEIYKEAALTNVWGNNCVGGHLGCFASIGQTGQIGTGTGSPVSFTTYGRVFPAGLFYSNSPSPGNYEDTVAVQVDF